MLEYFKKFEIPQDKEEKEKFMPSTQSQKRWLSTKKTKRTYASVTLPGLYGTEAYGVYIFLVFIILSLELGAFAIGLSEGMTGIVVGLAIGVDFLLAFGSHWWDNKICLYKNELIIIQTPENRNVRESKLSSLMTTKRVFYIAILASATIKAYIYWVVHVDFDIWLVSVTLAYLVGAILHINYTGYALFTFRFNLYVIPEHKKYSKGKNNTDFKSVPIKFHTNIPIIPVKEAYHTLEKTGNTNQKGEFEYLFRTEGILTDTQLQRMINKQTEADAKRKLASIGLHQQLTIYDDGLANIEIDIEKL